MVKLGENFVHWNRLLRTEREGIHPPFPPGPLRKGWTDRGSSWPQHFSWVNLTQNWWVTQKRLPFSQSWVEKTRISETCIQGEQPYWLEIENPTQTRESKKMIVWFLHPECLQVGLALSDSPAHSSEMYLWPRQRGALKPLAFRIWLKDIHWLL